VNDKLVSLLAEASRLSRDVWQWSSRWRYRWHALAVLLAPGLAVGFGPGIVRRLRSTREYRRGWIAKTVRVQQRRRNRVPIGRRISDWAQSLSAPDAQTVATALILVLLGYPLQYLLSWAPLRRLLVVSEQSIETLLGTLLQSHATVAGVALPLVIFLIERAKDEEETRLPASEVIMRESYIVPVTMFALFCAMKMAVDLAAAISRVPGVLAVNTIMFVVTVAFTARAIILTLSLSFSRARLKDRGLDLVRIKAAASAERSVHSRLSENALVQIAQEMGVGFWLFGVDRDTRDRFYVIEAVRRCRLTDVNRIGLRDFVEALPFKVPPARAIAGDATVDEDASVRPGRQDREKVFLVRRIGDSIHERAGALLLVDKASIESFEGVDSPYWLRRIFRLDEA
jgi:hypothetical protein